MMKLLNLLPANQSNAKKILIVFSLSKLLLLLLSITGNGQTEPQMGFILEGWKYKLYNTIGNFNVKPSKIQILWIKFDPF